MESLGWKNCLVLPKAKVIMFKISMSSHYMCQSALWFIDAKIIR